MVGWPSINVYKYLLIDWLPFVFYSKSISTFYEIQPHFYLWTFRLGLKTPLPHPSPTLVLLLHRSPSLIIYFLRLFLLYLLHLPNRLLYHLLKFNHYLLTFNLQSLSLINYFYFLAILWIRNFRISTIIYLHSWVYFR